jgi:hypothetical protein
MFLRAGLASLIFAGVWGFHALRVTRDVSEPIARKPRVAASRAGLSPDVSTTALAARVTAQAPRHGIAAPPATPERRAESYGKLPLSFEVNQGQTDRQVKFLSRGRGYALFLTGDEAVLTLQTAGEKVPGSPESVLRMRLVGANANATVTGGDELPGKTNYFVGNDPRKWSTDVPNYAQVKYQNSYPGVDLVYYGNQGGQLEYDFVVAPGADPSVIALDVAAGLPRHRLGKNRGIMAPLQIASGGDLVVKIDSGEIRFHKPVVYQPAMHDGQRTALQGQYILQGRNRVGFKVSSYDHTKPLVIDPVLSYSTFLGGSGADQGTGIAVDSLGNAYVTGSTGSANFPGATSSPLQNSLGGTAGNAFVTKINAAGTALIYSTYLGGSGGDFAYAIALDPLGNVYVTGSTSSTNFPVTGPIQPSFQGQQDAFVAEINAAGSALVYATYLGGNGYSYGQGIAVDPLGNAYVSGATTSNNFPVANPIQPSLGGGQNAFVSKINAGGTALVYSTYLGGSSSDIGFGIAVDSLGNAYVTGQATSANFPVASPIQPSLGGAGGNAFVTKINAAGTALAYSTYLGGSGGDLGFGIAVDALGSAYVNGLTSSTDFPVASPIQPSLGGVQNAFVTKINTAGTALVYSTYLGGSGRDNGTGIAVDSLGNAYVTGATSSTNFPGTSTSAIQPTFGDNTDAFVTEINAAGTALVYSTYLGGTGNDSATGIAVDQYGNAYVAGTTNSTNFPGTSVSVIQSTFATGGSDGFVAKIGGAIPTTTTVLASANPSDFGLSVTFTATVSSGSGTPTGFASFQVNGAPVATQAQALISGQATYTTENLVPGTYTITATYFPLTNFGGSTGTLTETINTFEGAVPLLSGNNTFTGNQTVNGNVSATNFVGSGAGLTGVVAATANTATTAGTATNALSLDGILGGNFARLDIGNSLTGDQTVTGNVSATGSVSGGLGNFTGALTGTTATFSGALAAQGAALPATGIATSAQGFTSNPLDLLASSFNSGNSTAVPQLFRWQAEPVSNNTANPSGKLDLLYLSGTGTPGETGLSIASNGMITFASGQSFPLTCTGCVGNTQLAVNYAGSASKGGPAITALTADSAIIAGTAALATNSLSLGGISAADFARLNIGNGFTGNQSVAGNLSTTGSVTIGGGTPIVEHLSLTFKPSFAALQAGACSSANFTFAGASDGNTIALGVPNERMTGGGILLYTAWVSAANTITIRACNISPSVPQTTPGSGAIRVDVWKH